MGSRFNEVINDKIVFRRDNSLNAPENGAWRAVDTVSGKIREVELNFAFGPGFYIQDMGTTEQIMQVNLTARHWMSIHFRGRKITKVFVTREGVTKEHNYVFCLPVDHPVLQFFEFTKG